MSRGRLEVCLPSRMQRYSDREAALNKRWDSIVNVLNQGMKTKFSCLTGVMPASDERAWMHRLELTKSKACIDLSLVSPSCMFSL